MIIAVPQGDGELATIRIATKAVAHWAAALIHCGMERGALADDLAFAWRGALTDGEMADLINSHGGAAVTGWWDRIRPHSLGWVTARDPHGTLVGFVNVAWDGGDHAFLLDTKTRGTHQHRGIGSQVVRQAVAHSRASGCEWLHVDFERGLEPFYFGACEFRDTAAGLIHLSSAT